MSELNMSKMHIFSIGLALSNVTKNGDEITVLPIEQSFGLEGELNHLPNAEQVNIKDESESDITINLKTSAGIKAKWFRLAEPNRLTAPNIRRGATVIIWQFDNTDEYFWEPYNKNSIRMALEHVTYRWSGTPKEGEEPRTDNSYWCSVSTIDKSVVFQTSMANGEKASYFLQFDTGNGLFTVKDNKETGFQINSEKEGGEVAFQTAAGGFVSLQNRTLTIDVDKIVERAKTRESNIDETTVTGTTHNNGTISSDVDVIAAGVSGKHHKHRDSLNGLCTEPF